MLREAFRRWRGIPETAASCPLCGGTRFRAFRGRPFAECKGCLSKERQRMLALFLPYLDVDDRNSCLPMVHVAPEPAIAALLHRRFPDTYTPADIDPERFKGSPVPLVKLDLTKVGATFRPGSVGGFIHSHVLEHLPVPLSAVLPDMNNCLAPGGFHLFQLPIYPGQTTEDFSPDLTKAERKARFGQGDHMRRQGSDDLHRDILVHFEGMTRIAVSDFVTPEVAERARIPARAVTSDTAHTLFAFFKSG